MALVRHAQEPSVLFESRICFSYRHFTAFRRAEPCPRGMDHDAIAAGNRAVLRRSEAPPDDLNVPFRIHLTDPRTQPRAPRNFFSGLDSDRSRVWIRNELPQHGFRPTTWILAALLLVCHLFPRLLDNSMPVLGMALTGTGVMRRVSRRPQHARRLQANVPFGRARRRPLI